MKIPAPKLFFFLLLFLATNTYAQIPFECIYAIEACDSSALDINYDPGTGWISESIESFCPQSSVVDTSFLRLNTVWFKYRFVSAGDFLFTVTPEDEKNDIDFVVFNSPTNNCMDMVSIRCMFSGEGANDSSSCSGATGLSLNSTDVMEEAGCDANDDNFLAPVEVEAGDVLLVAITSFSGINNYKVQHGGSAEIGCQPLHILEKQNQSIRVYPNPVRNALTVEFPEGTVKLYRVEIYDASGKQVATKQLLSSDTVDVSQLSSGIYFVKVFTDHAFPYVTKMIK